jgi:hypothetical protein
MAIDGARIQRVTSEGLFYLDDDGEERFIDLEAIHQQKLAKFLDPKSLRQYQAKNALNDHELERAIEARKATKDVGDWIPPHNAGSVVIFYTCYIDFDTEPPTRFAFDLLSEHTDRIDAHLKQHGWWLHGHRWPGGRMPPGRLS